ncbi:MAG: ABC transporter substrate-binding protein, partial [Cyanobacteria bacterium REEB65]|nr:ABC transporter substrate-binding protein [Cyanobacteria bacterium REEB65]
DLLGVHRPIDGADFVRLRQDPNWRARFVHAPEMATYYLGMNTEIPPFDDVRVRRAVALAVDRSHLVQLLNGRAVPAAGFLPPDLPGIDHDRALRGQAAPATNQRDLAKAKALLTEAGHSEGFSATLYCSNADSTMRLAAAIGQDLADAGIRLSLDPLSFATFLTAVGQRRNVPLFLANWVADYPDASDFLVPLFSAANIHDKDSRNTTFFDDPTYETLLARAARQTTAARRLALYSAAERELLKEQPIVPLFHPVTYQLTQPWVHGYRIHPIWPLNLHGLHLAGSPTT